MQIHVHMAVIIVRLKPFTLFNNNDIIRLKCFYRGRWQHQERRWAKGEREVGGVVAGEVKEDVIHDKVPGAIW